MGRKRFHDMACSVAQALEVLGDWWTLLIVREAFFGTRRFVDFARHLGLAKNTLSDRLSHLVENEILEKVDSGTLGTRYEYQLTDKGRDLLPVLPALRQWSDEWVYGEGNEPTIGPRPRHRSASAEDGPSRCRRPRTHLTGPAGRAWAGRGRRAAGAIRRGVAAPGRAPGGRPGRGATDLKPDPCLALKPPPMSHIRYHRDGEGEGTFSIPKEPLGAGRGDDVGSMVLERVGKPV